MPGHYGGGTDAPVVPTTGLPPEPTHIDPNATDADNTEDIDNLVRQLNEVRSTLSTMMAEDAKEFSTARPFQRSPLSLEELDRRNEHEKLEDRENQLMAMIREQRGE